MTASTPATRITLRALHGAPLADRSIRDMVAATARAIAERQGVTLLDVTADDSSITVTVASDRITALGLVTELRRLTTNWYRAKFGAQSLWGEVA